MSRYVGSLGSLGSASSVSDATKALESVNKLMQTADPFMKMALQTFKTAVSVNPAMLDSALAVVPEPFKSQIKASLATGPAPTPKASTATKSVSSSINWTPWLIGGGVVGGGLALFLVSRRKKTA
jgi:hypothetical protein